MGPGVTTLPIVRASGADMQQGSEWLCSSAITQKFGLAKRRLRMLSILRLSCTQQAGIIACELTMRCPHGPLLRVYCSDLTSPLETAVADSYLQFVRPSDQIPFGQQLYLACRSLEKKLVGLPRYKRRHCRSSSLGTDYQFPNSSRAFSNQLSSQCLSLVFPP